MSFSPTNSEQLAEENARAPSGDKRCANARRGAVAIWPASAPRHQSKTSPSGFLPIAQPGNADSDARELAEIAQTVNGAISRMEASKLEDFISQVETGRALLRAKALIRHGGFEIWADANIDARRTWRCLVMELARSEPYFKRAAAWAAETGRPVVRSVRGVIMLVAAFRIEIGEIAAPAPKRNETAADKLARLEKEISRLAAADEASRDDNARLRRENHFLKVFAGVKKMRRPRSPDPRQGDFFKPAPSVAEIDGAQP